MNIQQIATLAHKQKKCNKNSAFEIIKKMEFSDQDIVDLYSHFMPSIPAKPKTPEQWVARVAPKKDVRKYLNAVYSDGKRIYATDGHRLHIYRTNKYAQGYYNIALDPIDHLGKYPDVSYLFQSTKNHNVELKDMTLEHTRFGLAYKFKDGLGFDQKYVDDAINQKEDVSLIVSEGFNGHTRLIIKTELTTALIMSVII